MIFKDKVCIKCTQVFTPQSRTKKHCDECYAKHLKTYRAKLNRDQRIKRGAKVDVGKGGLQKERLGEKSPSYKNGIGIYRLLLEREGIPFVCVKCNKQLDKAKPFEWCTHHKDEDRTNNTLDNLEYLCKRCHQLEHQCWKALGIDIDEQDVAHVKAYAQQRN